MYGLGSKQVVDSDCFTIGQHSFSSNGDTAVHGKHDGVRRIWKYYSSLAGVKLQIGVRRWFSEAPMQTSRKMRF